MSIDKSTVTKAPVDTKATGTDGDKHDGDRAVKADPLHKQVHHIHAGGNLKPTDGQIHKDRADAAHAYGNVELHGNAKAAKEGDKPGTAKEPPKPLPKVEVPKAPPKPATVSHDTGVLGWMKSVEHAGEATLHAWEHKAVDTASAVAHSNFVHNNMDIAKTLASGVGEAAMNVVHGVEHGTEAAVKGIEHGAEWAYHNPGKAALIGTAAVGLVVLDAATGFTATGAIVAGASAVGTFLGSSAAATTFEVAGLAAAGTATAGAGIDLYKHGETRTLMNQQNESPEAVKAAREQLKKDTGNALLGDLTLGAGYLIKGGAAAISALRGSSAEATTVAEAAQATKTAGHATEAGETGTATGSGHIAGEAPHADANLTPGEHLAAQLAEEVADVGATGLSIASLFERAGQFCSSAGTAYENISGVNSTVSTVTNTGDLFGKIADGYSVATPQSHNNEKKMASLLPDEPTKH